MRVSFAFAGGWRAVAIIVAGVAAIVAGWQNAQASKVVLASSLVDRLESRIGRAAIGDWSTVTGIVVLGGSGDRFVEAGRLAREHPHLRIVLSTNTSWEVGLVRGGTGRPDDLPPLPPQRLEIEDRSFNTFTNATYTKAMVAARPGERWLLVTSAAHMPRAIGTFYRAGFYVEPWPVRERLRDASFLTHVAQREWLGLVAYWMRGRTIAMFPSGADLTRWMSGEHDRG